MHGQLAVDSACATGLDDTQNEGMPIVVRPKPFVGTSIGSVQGHRLSSKSETLTNQIDLLSEHRAGGSRLEPQENNSRLILICERL